MYISKGEHIQISGFWRYTNFVKDLINLFKLPEFQGLLLPNSDTKELYFDEVMDLALIKKREMEEEIKKKEEERIASWIANLNQVIGSEIDCWCLFEQPCLFLYQVDKSNENRLIDLFQTGIAKDPCEYLTMYSKYKAKIRNPIELAQEARLHSVKDVSISFEAGEYRLEPAGALISNLYSMRWSNLQILGRREKKLSIVMHLEIGALLRDYQIMDQFLEENPCEELRLHLSDQKLITYYILGTKDLVEKLARETLPLCEKFEHQKGKQFREVLLTADADKPNATYEKVSSYANNYIWL